MGYGCTQFKVSSNWLRVWVGALVLGGLVILAGLPSANAESHEIRAGIPEGFRDLIVADADLDDVPLAPPPRALGEQMFYAEFFVDGQRRGDVILALHGDVLAFDQPDLAVSLIPDVRRADELATLLREGLSTESPKLCLLKPSTPCTQPVIGKFGLILDLQIQRIDLFRSHRYVQPPEPVRPSHPSAPGLIANLTGRVAGRNSSNGDVMRGSLGFDVIAGMGATSAFMRGSVIDDGQTNVRIAGLQHYSGRNRFAGGFFPATASDHFSQVDLVGVEFHTTDLTQPAPDTRRDTPILLFLENDSYIDILRDGELLFAGELSAGSVRVPTARFPSGSYNVTVRIRDQAGNETEETRFFSRPNDYARVNQWNYRFQLGQTRDISSNRFGLAEDGLFYASADANRQIGRDSLVGARVGVIGELGFTEAFAQRNLGQLYARGSGLVTSEGGYSFAAQVSGRLEKMSISSQIRQSDITNTTQAFRGRRGNTTEATLNLNREVPIVGGQLNSFARYVSREQQGDRTSWGANWEKRVPLFDGRANGVFSLGYQQTDVEQRFLVGYRMNWQSRRSALSAQIRHQRSEQRNGPGHFAQTVQDLRAAYRSAPESRNSWTLGASASDFGNSEGRYGASGQITTDQYVADGQIDRNYGSSSASNYFGSFSTAAAVTAGGLAFSGDQNARSGVLFDMRGVEERETIQTTVDGNRYKSSRKRVAFKSVQPFRQSKVRFRPDRGSTLGYDAKSIELTAFPGNIVTINPILFQQVTVFARLVDVDGEPLKQHAVVVDGVNYPSDENGFVLLDLRLDSTQLNVSHHRRNVCQLDLPSLRSHRADEFVDLGDLRCASDHLTIKSVDTKKPI